MRRGQGQVDIILTAPAASAGTGRNCARLTPLSQPDPDTLFTGRRFHIVRRQFNVAGQEHTHEIIKHPGAALILPVRYDGQLVLIHNYRPAVQTELLEIPAGTLEPDETPAECAARELTEETGYRAERLAPLLSFYSTPGILDEQMHLFLATGLSPGPTAHDASEQIRVTTMTLADALEAVRAGRVTDGKTIVALLYYDRFVRSAEGG